MATTPKFALPYPLGSDLIANGDDVIHSLADRVEAILGTVAKAGASKSVGLTGFKPSGFTVVSAATATLTMTTGALCLVKAAVDISSMTGTGFVTCRIGTDTQSNAAYYESGSGRAELQPWAVMFAPAGATSLQLFVSTFANPASGITVNSCSWNVYALGGTPTVS